MQLEILGGQLACVGYGCGLNWMVCGPFPGPSDALMGFLKKCAAVVPDLSVSQARRPVS